LFAVSLLPLVDGAAQILRQPKPSTSRAVQMTARISCHFSGSDFLNTFIHCYEHKPREAPKHILYVQSGVPYFYEKSYRDIFWAKKVRTESICTLTINKITKQQEATYYCGSWGRTALENHQVFGSGTKLTVSGNSPPAHSEILQKNHGNQTTYVCLIEKFYPEVIRVTWTDEAHKEVTDNVVQGDPWKATKEGKYSISSWLTVSAANKDKNYHCKYEHESKEHSLQAQGTYYMLRIFILRIIRDLTFSLQ
uniref:Ig-like domain-containing protein n=1 Tax=Aquila chrysaetos chrysaetos TaxID=223781 RepID=A0A663E4P9_AQUCH